MSQGWFTKAMDYSTSSANYPSQAALNEILRELQ